MNPDNRWIQMADKFPWDLFEEKYANLFPSDTGNVGKPLCMTLGSLIIQNRFQYPDRELVERITANMLNEANEYLLAHKDDKHPKQPSSGKDTDESCISKEETGNRGTLVIDAACAPANIRLPYV
ncbi:hypothetical protein AALA90_16390 [Lachnospiraceae bacterium 38-10]